MITVKSRKLDSIAKLEIVLLEDKFGTQQVIQHPLTKPGYDAVAFEAEIVNEMQAAETAWENAVAQRSQ